MKNSGIKLRSSFTSQNREQIAKAVTGKIEKIINSRRKMPCHSGNSAEGR